MTKQIALTRNADLVLHIFADLEAIKTQTTLGKNQVYLFIRAVKQLDSDDYAALGKSIAIESGLIATEDTYETLEKLGRDWTLKKSEAFLVALKSNIPNNSIN